MQRESFSPYPYEYLIRRRKATWIAVNLASPDHAHAHSKQSVVREVYAHLQHVILRIKPPVKTREGYGSCGNVRTYQV